MGTRFESGAWDVFCCFGQVNPLLIDLRFIYDSARFAIYVAIYSYYLAELSFDMSCSCMLVMSWHRRCDARGDELGKSSPIPS